MRTIGCLFLLAWASSAAAQTGTELPPPPPPPSYPEAGASPAQPAPAPPPPEAGAAPGAQGAACVPACRGGFVCVEGQCVTACNPPCAAGEQCTASGECAAPASGAPPGQFYSQPEPPIPAPDTGAEQHDGFMLRLALGFGTSTATEKPEDTLLGYSEAEYTGFSGTFSLDLGGAPVDDLVIHARLSDFFNVSPNLALDGEDQGELEDISLAAAMFGLGVTYYFMPVNIYLTGVVGPSWLTVNSSNTDQSESTDMGLGLNFDVGKEWWAGDNWGLGAAARLWYTALQHEDSAFGKVNYTFFGFAVMFSATYQ